MVDVPTARAREDAELLRLAATDPAALGVLYERYARLVCGLGLALLGSREEAEDLTQDVFIAVCAVTSYDPDRGSVAAFLTAMTRSRAIDRLRCRGRASRLVQSWHEEATTTAAPSPFECVATRRAALRVRAVLTDLPPTERQVLELAYYEGLSQREIAADLDTPLGTVKTVSRRGLAALGRALRAH